MINKVVFASICAACVISLSPAQAAHREWRVGKTNKATMQYTKRQMMLHRKENRAANANVDRMIKNRR